MPARATRKLAAGVPLIRVELARDAELDELPAADGVSPAAEGASDERHVLWIDGEAIASSCAASSRWARRAA